MTGLSSNERLIVLLLILGALIVHHLGFSALMLFTLPIASQR